MLSYAAGPLVPGNGGADMVRASSLARGGNFFLRFAVCQGNDLVIKARARVRVGTFVDAPITFFIILYLTRRWGWKVAVASAVIGTAAAPT